MTITMLGHKLSSAIHLKTSSNVEHHQVQISRNARTRMSTKPVGRTDAAKVVPMSAKPVKISDLLQLYGCGPIPFVGTENALYERHLVFDRAIDPKIASARERFEAFSHSVRDILAQRWVKTKTTYEQQNAKRIY